MKIKTSELTGAALDWAVSECEFLRRESEGDYVKSWVRDMHLACALAGNDYSTDWALGGPIIEQADIDVMKVGIHQWRADCGPACYGQTPLVAAMRSYVAKRLGAEVEIPDSLA